jgi:integrase
MKHTKRYELTNQKYLLDEELAALNATLTRFRDQDARNCTMLWLALHTGARATELLNLTTQDFNLTAKTVFIRGIKESDNREIPLPTWLFNRIKQMLPESGRVFPISYNRFREVWVLYRPVKKKLHSLRHTFAINLYRKAKDILILKAALGHRSLDNTMIYATYQYKTDELRKAILG